MFAPGGYVKNVLRWRGRLGCAANSTAMAVAAVRMNETLASSIVNHASHDPPVTKYATNVTHDPKRIAIAKAKEAITIGGAGNPRRPSIESKQSRQ